MYSSVTNDMRKAVEHISHLPQAISNVQRNSNLMNWLFSQTLREKCAEAFFGVCVCVCVYVCSISPQHNQNNQYTVSHLLI
jgi:hypothetical protein